jgi:hypothetical protein
MRQEFSTLDIVKALDIPRERLREWMNRGFIEPSQPAEGQGTKAVFSRDAVYRVALFRELLNKGFTRKKAAAFLRINPLLQVVDQPTYLVFSFGDFGFSDSAVGVRRITDDDELAAYFKTREYLQTSSAELSGLLIFNYYGLRSKVDRALEILE